MERDETSITSSGSGDYEEDDDDDLEEDDEGRKKQINIFIDEGNTWDLPRFV